MTNNISDLEQALGYSFKNNLLITEALTHPSLKQLDKSVRDYERLELLGDSILGFIVTEMIYNKFIDYEEGSLAKIKAHVVSCEIIVKVAKQISLADYMILTKGEENSGGRDNRNNMENTLEAVLAAIYLDSDIDTTRAIITNLWVDHIENVDFSDADPKTYLQEYVQRQGEPIPEYIEIAREGFAHSPIFTIRVQTKNHSETGSAHSIKEAEKDAARKLLHKIKNKDK